MLGESDNRIFGWSLIIFSAVMIPVVIWFYHFYLIAENRGDLPLTFSGRLRYSLPIAGIFIVLLLYGGVLVNRANRAR